MNPKEMTIRFSIDAVIRALWYSDGSGAAASDIGIDCNCLPEAFHCCRVTLDEDHGTIEFELEEKEREP